MRLARTSRTSSRNPCCALVLVQEVEEHECDQRYRDLNAHGVLGAADEMGDFQHLFHQAEEQLDQPAPLVEIGDLLGGRVEIVGEDAQRLAGVGRHDISRTACCIGFWRLLACRAGKKPMRSDRARDPGSSGGSRAWQSGVLVLNRVTMRQQA